MNTDGPVTEPLAPGDGSVVVSPVVRVRLDISYDGTGFAGWAAQPGQRTVAGSLTNALQTLVRRPVPIVVAGRTDAGVHAVGQVAHVDLTEAELVALAPRPGLRGERHTEVSEAGPVDGLRGLLRRLNGLLPADVRVRSTRFAPPGFDARFAALRRHYRYRVATTPAGADPLRRFDTWSRTRPLDVIAIDLAARTLIGLHDFAAYCKAPVKAEASTIRDLQAISVRELVDEPGVLAIDVTADAFCHSMVRALVGTLVAVGEGRLPIDRPASLLADRRRTSAIPVAPARGLTLLRVDYPADEALASRAESTRAVRRPSD